MKQPPEASMQGSHKNQYQALLLLDLHFIRNFTPSGRIGGNEHRMMFSQMHSSMSSLSHYPLLCAVVICLFPSTLLYLTVRILSSVLCPFVRSTVRSLEEISLHHRCVD